MSEKIPYEKVMGRMRMDIDYIAEEAYQKGYDEAKLIYQNPNAESDYQRGLDDAWEAARAIVWNTSLDDWISVGVDIGEWDGDESEALNRYSISEAIEILKEMSKPKPDEIKVGDEITSTYSGERGPAVVVQVTRGDVYYVYADGKIGNNTIASDSVKKTGRHFPEVVQLFEKMKDGAK